MRKFELKPQQQHHLKRIALYVAISLFIVFMMPSANKFKYQFEIGKPWTYGLVTAPFDFPIYKSNTQISKEKEELLKDFSPYYKIDSMLVLKTIARLESDWSASNPENKKYIPYLQNMLKRIYSTGIITIKEHNILINTKRTNITCINGNRTTYTSPVHNLYTPLSAYQTIVKNSPSGFKAENLNLFITDNLKYDSATTELSKSDILKNLSLTNGMIQVGERIIGPGEIVTPQSFQALYSLKMESGKRNASIQKSSLVLVGEIIMVMGLMALLFLYIYLFRTRIYDNLGNQILILSLLVSVITISALSIRLGAFNHLMIPYAILPIVIRVFFDSRTALFAHIITMLIISLMVDNSFHFSLLQITIGMSAVSSLKDMSQRSQLTQTAIVIFLCYLFMFMAFEFISEGDINRVNWHYVLYFAVSSTSLLLAYIVIYIFEKIFGLVSSVTLVELTNINSDLMMEFSERAPGTFQHSLQVSSLATEAAKKINANSLLVRTGALYHDIGKMKHPEYFIENQIDGKNLLSDCDFEEGSKIVINHVTDGVEIAKKNHLPDQIINFIGTHHGMSKTKYFYNSYINANPDKKPDEAVFTYPGPLPNNKESAILMMADAVEARSRSLGEYTEESIHNMVECMIDAQIADGQFKDAPITFQDVETVKKVFTDKLKSFYHSRIVYPELKKL